MKKLLDFDKELGGDGGKVEGALGIDGDHLSAQVAVKYPLAKVVEPATKALDKALDKLEKLIPGDWDKPLIEKIKVEYKEELIELLAEKPAQTPA